MRRTVLLVGNSPLLYFVARELNQSLARQVENNVVWLTSEKYLTDLALNQGWAGSSGKVLLSKHLENIKLVRGGVKSISLSNRRAVTTKGQIDYDILVVDQLPLYQHEELISINKAVTDLLLSVKASHNQSQPKTARIICKGDSAESLELACRISELIRTNFPRQVRSVAVDSPITGNQKAASSFIKSNNLHETTTKKADLTLTLETPKPYLPLQNIKGLKVGLKGWPLVRDDLQAKDWPGVVIVDGPSRQWQNLLHFQKSMAKRVAQNIAALLANQPTKPVELAEKAIFLSANQVVFVELGTMVSNRLRARLISRLEHRLFRRLQD